MLHYVDGEKRYILHCKGLVIGDVILSDYEAPVKLGNSLPLSNLPLGTIIHNVEFQVRIVFLLIFFVLKDFRICFIFLSFTLNSYKFY